MLVMPAMTLVAAVRMLSRMLAVGSVSAVAMGIVPAVHLVVGVLDG
jgi:hypothetical protein